MPDVGTSDRPSAPAINAAGGTALLQESALRVLRACDVVFGGTTVAMAVFAFILVATGQARLTTAIAVAAVPAFNLAWSKWTTGHERIRADLIRGAVCIPLTAFVYQSEGGGMLAHQWLPALLVCLGATLSVSIASRRSILGSGVSLAYAAGLVIAELIDSGEVPSDVFDDALALLLVGVIIAIVASQFGRTIEEVRVQRDLARIQKERAEEALEQLTDRTRELSAAIVNLNEEMVHRRKIELELHQAQKLESVGRLAAGIAHEINTPVQFVSDSLEFVRTAVGDLFDLVDKLAVVQRSVSSGAPNLCAANSAAEASEAADLPYLTTQVPKALELAAEGLGRVATIVRSMKEFARPDASDMVPTDLNRAVQSTLTMAHNEYRYVADLVVELGELPPVPCRIGELNQVVLNILVNAAHAIGDVVAGSERRGTITVKTYREGDDAVISVTDTGNGIPDTIRAQIFDPFFTTKEVGKGTGQGLAIARSVVVDKHRGKLTFESAVGGGTTFFIRVPIADGTTRVAA